MTVVTYNRDKKESDDKAKLRILLVSNSLLTLSSHLCFKRLLHSLVPWRFRGVREKGYQNFLFQSWTVYDNSQVGYCWCFDRWFLVFQTFGQHARELITTELALRLLSILSEEEFLPNVNRSALNRTLDRLLIKVIFNDFLNICLSLHVDNWRKCDPQSRYVAI